MVETRKPTVIGLGAEPNKKNDLEALKKELEKATSDNEKLKKEIDSLKNPKPKSLTAEECKKILTEKSITFDEKAKVDELRKLVEENQ